VKALQLGVLCALCVVIVPPGEARGECFPTLIFADPRAGTPLLEVDLSTSDGRFSLSYVHSVRHTPVVSTYQVESEGIRQISEVFSDPGYGMGGVTKGSDELKVSRTPRGQKILLDRPIPDFVLRLQRAQKNRLEVPISVHLAEILGDRAVRLKPACR